MQKLIICIASTICILKKISPGKEEGMPSNRTKNQEAGSKQTHHTDVFPARHKAGSKTYVEDGWVFRVTPGAPIECRRDEDSAQNDVPLPHRARHNYPSS